MRMTTGDRRPPNTAADWSHVPGVLGDARTRQSVTGIRLMIAVLGPRALCLPALSDKLLVENPDGSGSFLVVNPNIAEWSLLVESANC
jgi:hypothetical protein